MSHIFISYSHKDKEYVHKLRDALRERGFDAWIAEGISYGTQRWSREIKKNLDECDAFVLVMTPDSYESEWVENELLAARDLKKPILPLLLAGEIWWDVRTIQIVDVSDGSLPQDNFYIRLARYQTSAEHKTTPTDAPKNEIHITGNVSGSTIIIGDANEIKNEAIPPRPKPVQETQRRRKTVRVYNKTEPHIKEIQSTVEESKPIIEESRPTAEKNKPTIEESKPTVEKKYHDVVNNNYTIPHTRNLTGIAATLGACIILSLIGIAVTWAMSNGTKNEPASTATHTLQPQNSTIPTFQATATRTPQQQNSATPLPTAIPLEINQNGAVMRLIPAGSFMMGRDPGESDEKPPHSVSLPAFYMDKYEVSNKLYKACESPSCIPPTYIRSHTRTNYYGDPNFDNFPVIYVSWNQASAYCIWRGGRLPTEAEWEYAARGTDGRTYPWGDDIDKSRANYYPEGKDTTAVDSYEAGKSPFGLYNMVGNVWEWVNDWYNETYYQSAPSINPQGPATGQYRVLRGGGWNYNDYGIRAVYRGWLDPKSTDNKDGNIGFRCAYSP